VVKARAEDIGEQSRGFSHRDASQLLSGHAWRRQAVAVGPHTADASVQVSSQRYPLRERDSKQAA